MSDDAAALDELRARARAKTALLELQSRTDLGLYIERRSVGKKEPYARPRHLKPLLDAFDDMARGESVFADCDVAPRHAKTETVLHGAVRYLERWPDRLVVYASYSAAFANRKSRRARDIAARSSIGFHRSAFTRDRGTNPLDPSASVQFWQTAESGGFLAVGRGGPLKGEGVHLLIIDDPYKDRAEAESPVIRDDVREWFQGTAFDRLEPGGSCIVMHQRWHEDDLIGWIRNELAPQPDAAPWRNISIPAVSDAGEPLWPERYTLADLNRIRATIGEYNWWSQYQGKPRPRGNRLFSTPARWTTRQPGAVILISADLATTAKAHADWTVATVIAYWREPDGLLRGQLLDVRRGQWETPQVVAVLAELQKKWGALLVVEAHGIGSPIIQTLRSVDRSIHVVEERPLGDKHERAQPVAAASAQGRFTVPADATADLTAYLRTLHDFTGIGDSCDDDVDATSLGWNYADRHVSSPIPDKRPRRQRAMASSPF